MSGRIKIESVASTEREQRIAAHSHLHGLGLQSDGTPNPNAAGFVGQTQAREAAGIIVLQELVKLQLL